jgi:hypothetical protein
MSTNFPSGCPARRASLAFYQWRTISCLIGESPSPKERNGFAPANSFFRTPKITESHPALLTSFENGESLSDNHLNCISALEAQHKPM